MIKLKKALRVTARVLASVVGAYFVAAGATALIAVLLVLGADASRSDALISGSMFGYLLFALVMLWCFAERRLGRVWLVLVGAAVATHLAALWIESTLPVSGAIS